MTHPEGTGRGVVEVGLATDDEDYPLVALSAALECRLELREIATREDGVAVELWGVERAAPELVLAATEELEEVTGDLLAGHEDGGLFQFRVRRSCPVDDATRLGAVAHDAVAEHGHGRLWISIPPGTDPGELVRELLDRHPSLDLRTKRGQDNPRSLYGAGELRVAVERKLTERQAEVLALAHEAGYYERPRRTSGEALAAELDINAATFNEHLREAERKLVDAVYGEPDGQPADAAADRSRA